MPSWPTADIAQGPLVGTLEITSEPNISEFKADVFSSMIRSRRYTAKSYTYSATFLLYTMAQKEALESFFTNDCADGVLPFDMNDWEDGLPASFMWIQAPTYTHVHTEVWRASVRLFKVPVAPEPSEVANFASLNTAIPWPGVSVGIPGAPANASGTTVDLAGEYLAFAFIAREAMSISHVGFRCGVATGSPTLDIRIETVGADGNPSGTLWSANTNIVTGALSTGWNLHALTSPAVILPGQSFCVKFVYNSGTSIRLDLLDNVKGDLTNHPYAITNITGAAVRSRPLGQYIALGSGLLSFYSLPVAWAHSSVSNSAFNNTNSAARANRFKVPFRCRVAGLRIWLSTGIGNFNYGIMDDFGVSLGTTAFDGDQSGINAGGCHELYFGTPIFLDADTWYRAFVEPSSATNVTTSIVTLPSAAYRSSWPGGTDFHYAARASGSWNDTLTNQIMLLDLMIDKFIG